MGRCNCRPWGGVTVAQQPRHAPETSIEKGLPVEATKRRTVKPSATGRTKSTKKVPPKNKARPKTKEAATTGKARSTKAGRPTKGRTGAQARDLRAARDQALQEASVGRLIHDESEADDDGFISGAGFDRYGGFPGDGLS
jgi:hypothetical protein